MLPKEIIKRFMKPGQLEREFLNYLKKSNASINQDKTIASQVLYDSKYDIANNTKRLSFFTGTVDPTLTNIDTGSFVRPESENFLIYAIRLYVCTNGAKVPNNAIIERGGSDFTPAVNNSFFSFVCNSVQYLKNVPFVDFQSTNVASNNRVYFIT